MTPLDLTSFPDFARLSAASRALVEAERIPFSHGPGRTIIHCGEAVEGTFLVSTGRLRIYVQDVEGREKTLYQVRPGETCILAVNAAFSGLVYPAWVTAGSDGVSGFVLPARTYRQLFENEPAVRDFTIRVLSTWIFDLMASLEEGALRSVAERLAHALVRRSDRRGVVRGTHQELAGDLGTAREVVSRHLAWFEQRGLVAKRRGVIELLDPQGLLRESAESPDA